MPGFCLNTMSSVACAHGGIAQPSLSSPRVKVMGTPVVTQVSPYAIAGCPNPPPASGGTGPCVTSQWVSGSSRVKVMGLPVLLQDSQAVCTPTGVPLIVQVTQARVKAL